MLKSILRSNIFQKSIKLILLVHEAIDKGLLLFISTIIAILMANSKFVDLYYGFIEQSFEISLGKRSFILSVHEWINEFFMSIFFLLVSIDIKCEVIDGNLKNRSQRILPIISAFFGVIFPVLIYILFNYKDEFAMRAWAVPATTDIAFSLGAFMIFCKGLPSDLKTFLIALAIVDDLIAITIVALFYKSTLQLKYLFYIIICCVVLYIFNRKKVSSLQAYMITGTFLWYFFFKSGVHSTISGVILGFFVPLKTVDNLSLKNLKRVLSLHINYFILPLFAFANSGISLSLVNMKSLCHPIVLGITFGLMVGKTIGISLTVYVLNFFKVVSFPRNVKIKHYYYVSILCGIGFTMSLFISLIAFSNDILYLELIKLGIVLGSVTSIIVVIVLIKIFKH